MLVPVGIIDKCNHCFMQLFFRRTDDKQLPEPLMTKMQHAIWVQNMVKSAARLILKTAPILHIPAINTSCTYAPQIDIPTPASVPLSSPGGFGRQRSANPTRVVSL